jgi:molybdopterin synthase catalytic subunit
MYDLNISDIQLLFTPLSFQVCSAFVADPAAGGTVIFTGAVRDHTQGKKVVQLEFEAYAPMAIAEMHKIARQIFEKWDITKFSMHHRTGILQVGELAVVIAVSAPHRKAAFEACQYAIDTLKQTVPIWKKEFFEDGEVWVAAHP